MDTTRDKNNERQDESTKTAYRKPSVTIEQPAAQPDVLGGASHVGCNVDANCPGQDEAG